MSTRDYAIAGSSPDQFVVHAATCPDVRSQAAMGVPVLTMFDCEGQLPDDLPRHECLEEEKP